MPVRYMWYLIVLKYFARDVKILFTIDKTFGIDSMPFVLRILAELIRKTAYTLRVFTRYLYSKENIEIT